MRGTFVDIDNELTDIAAEAAILSQALDIYDLTSADADPAWVWLAIQGLAAGVEKIYSGCERVMSMIAQTIDHAAIDRGEGWHVSLLKRMAHPFPGKRAAVISEECFRALDGLRAFRHRQRNSYGLSLDEKLVAERAAEAGPAFLMFRDDVARFMASHNG